VLGVVTGLTSEAKLLKGLGLACVSTGGRAHVARRKIERLIAEGATGLISFGIAGALSPELKTGDLVVAEAVVGEGGERWQAHHSWVDALLLATVVNGNLRQDDVPHHAAARRSEGHASVAPAWAFTRDDHPDVAPALSGDPSSGQTRAALWIPAQRRDDGRGSAKIGVVLGLDRMLSSPQEKSAAFARSGALAIDMESHHVAHAAADCGLPFVAIRAISDQAHEVLPAVMAGFVDAEGQTKMSAVLAALILGRVTLSELLQVGRASKRAHHALFRCRGALAGLR
jgi:adenosylhomocysteine nucleosidase